ncbi:MAG: TolC family protein [Betaproteobacteria bacterium]|nr:MAG: TolC family protein [Betaproteobacteria bacterium]
MQDQNAITGTDLEHLDQATFVGGKRTDAPLPDTTSLRSCTALRLGLGVVGVLLVGGCATLSPDGGFNTVREIVKERGGRDALWARTGADSEAIQTTVRQVLTHPLSVDDAVRIALINNRGLQATYAELGIAESDLVEASWPRNPGFAFSHLQGGGDKEIERSFMLELVSLLTIPLRVGIERERLASTQLAVAAEVLDVAAQARRAYYRTVAAQQTVQYMEQVQVAADASAELAGRMVKAGNWGKLEQAREESFYADAIAQVARARQTAVTEREKLIRLLGLSGADTEFKLPERLADLPNSIAEGTGIEARALADRLDVQAAKKDVESLAASLGLTKTTRFINVLEAGYKTKSETGLPLKRGYEVSVELPLFDWTGAKVARAEHVYMQGVNRAAEVAIDARSEVREAYSAYRTAYDLARQYRDRVLPLRKQIADENQLRYNGMLISVFELLADAREQVAGVNASIEALRDFWLAETDLHLAMTGSSSAFQRAARRTFTP